jgi:RNA polymerase sigma factor (TIGR02999 family)
LKPGETLHATALVHEAWIRLQGVEPKAWDNRAHFFGAAARSMRNILVDQARSNQRMRRNSGVRAISLGADDAVAAGDGSEEMDMLGLDEALNAMSAQFERPARIVMLRFFAGLSMAEVAELLGVTTRTVHRDYLFARTWLRRYMERE